MESPPEVLVPFICLGVKGHSPWQMMNQHRRSLLSQTTIQCPTEFSWDLVFMGHLGVSAQPWGLLVPDVGMSGNSSPFPTMMQEHGHSPYPPAVSQLEVSLLFTRIYRRS
jgi:hypothetical protein